MKSEVKILNVLLLIAIQSQRLRYHRIMNFLSCFSPYHNRPCQMLFINGIAVKNTQQVGDIIQVGELNLINVGGTFAL